MLLFRSLQEGDSPDESNTLGVEGTANRDAKLERRHSEGVYAEDEEVEKVQLKERNSLLTVIKSEEALQLKRWYSDNIRRDKDSNTNTPPKESSSPRDIIKNKAATLKRWFSLSGHEQPYSIKMSFVRDALGNTDDMVTAMDIDENEAASQLQFILRPTKKAPTKVSLGM